MSPAIRERIEHLWGARIFDHWGMTELGPLAIECPENPGGIHVLESECIAEILDPISHKPVEPRTEGELVVTNLGRIGSPLFRYRTGDLVKADPKPCPCGRSLLRLDGGILGRIDDMFTIRGNNVFPASIEAILRQFTEIAEYRIDVETRRSMQHVKITIEPHQRRGRGRSVGESQPGREGSSPFPGGSDHRRSRRASAIRTESPSILPAQADGRREVRRSKGGLRRCHSFRIA